MRFTGRALLPERPLETKSGETKRKAMLAGGCPAPLLLALAGQPGADGLEEGGAGDGGQGLVREPKEVDFVHPVVTVVEHQNPEFPLQEPPFGQVRVPVA